MALNSTYLYSANSLGESAPSVVELVGGSRGDHNISDQELQALLAEMKGVILKLLTTLTETMATEQEQNSQIAQLSVGFAMSQFHKAQKAEADLEKAMYEAAHPPWWKVILNIFAKYILPIVLCVVAFVVFGPAAGMIAAAAFLATAIPIHDGKSAFSLLAEAAAQGIGSMLNLSKDEIQLLKGAITVALGIIVAIAGGAATVGNIAASEAGLAEEALQAFANSAGRFVAANSLGSIVGNSDCWNDIFMASYMLQNPRANREKAEQFAAIFAVIMNVMVSLGCAAGAGFSLSSASETFSQFSPIARALGGLRSADFIKAMGALQTVANIAGAGQHISQGVIDVQIAQMTSQILRLMADVRFADGLADVLNSESGVVNNRMREAQKNYGDMLKERPRYASPKFTEARELTRNEKRA